MISKLEQCMEEIFTSLENINFGIGQFIPKMALGLKSYGDSQGYDYNYYEKISWGGLKDTNIFKNKTEEEKKEIDDTVEIELTGKDSEGNLKSQKGEKSGC